MIVLWMVVSAWASTVSGTVMNDDQLVSGAAVYLFDSSQQYLETMTNGDGWFQIDNAPNDWLRILVVTPVNSNAIPSYYPNTQDYCSAERFHGSNDHSIEINLHTGVTHTISLTADNELSNVLILAKPDGGLTRGGWVDETGTAWIGGLTPNTTVTISMEGDQIPEQWLASNNTTTYEAENAQAVNVVENQEMEIEVLSGITVSGLVHHGSNPIAEARVSVYSNSQIRNTTTDDDGLYTVVGLPPGEVLSWMSADGYGNTYSPNDDRPTSFLPILSEGDTYDLLDIEAPLESSISITLLDATTNEPIEGASVLLYNDTSTVGRGEPVDANGTATIRGLHAGRYKVYTYAKNDGYSNGYVNDVLGEALWFEVDEESTAEFAVYLESKNDALLEIMDDYGTPVSGVLTLLTSNADDHIFERDYSDSDGMSLLFGLDSGTWILSLSFDPVCANDVGYIIGDLPEITVPQQHIEQIILLRDDDQDGMPTQWEIEWGLDPFRNDATEDADSDGTSNLQEYLANSNPTETQAKTSCGCTDSSSQGWLLLTPLVLWRRRRG